MSLNTVIAFALLLKKITRKGSMGKKNFRNKMRKPKEATTPVATSRATHETSCSSSSDDEFEDDDDEDNIHIIQYNDYSLMNNNNKKSNSSIITAPSIKSLKQQQKHHSDMITMLSTSPSQQRKSLIALSSPDIAVKHNSTPVKVIDNDDVDEAITTTEVIDSDEITIVPTTVTDNEESDNESCSSTQYVTIRDFAYPVDSPLHYGKTLKPQYSFVSLSSPDFNGREARALFDFTPETEYELPLKTGQTIWVQYRQCPGWLIADVQDDTGLIPESYVEFI